MLAGHRDRRGRLVPAPVDVRAAADRARVRRVLRAVARARGVEHAVPAVLAAHVGVHRGDGRGRARALPGEARSRGRSVDQRRRPPRRARPGVGRRRARRARRHRSRGAPPRGGGARRAAASTAGRPDGNRPRTSIPSGSRRRSRAIATSALAVLVGDRQRLRPAARVERAERQPGDPRRGLGAVQLRRLPEPARVAGVPHRSSRRWTSSRPGRAMWEGGDAVGNYGTTLSLELLPYFTKGRIGSMEGLYFESSATVSFHFLTVSELAKQPSNPVRGLVYGTSTQPDRLRARREAPADARRELPDAVLAAVRRRWPPTSPT